jgi:hypothetical protein
MQAAKLATLYLTCLMGIMPASASAQPYVISVDGDEVTDQQTGLIWRRCAEGMHWNGATCASDAAPDAALWDTTHCTEGLNPDGSFCADNSPDAALWHASLLTHEQALQQAAAEARRTGIPWRLPNIKELSSIASNSRILPKIDTTIFPATPQRSPTWSSTPLVGTSSGAWVYSFSYGSTYTAGRNLTNYVRLVRNSQ